MAPQGVLKELVSDDLVREGKISGTLFCWSFPAEARTRKVAELEKARAQVHVQAAQIDELRAQVEAARQASGQSESDAARIHEVEEAIAAYKKREADTANETERLKKDGASNLALRRKDLPALREAANRWTDNCARAPAGVRPLLQRLSAALSTEPRAAPLRAGFETRKYLVEKCNCEPAQADKLLEIDDKFDYPE
jgi:hypothetical protein